MYGTNYKNFVNDINNNKKCNFLIYVNGKSLSLQANEDFSKITLFSCELYNQPWVWYHVIIDNKLYIFRNVLSTDFSIENDDSICDVLEKIAPKAPNIDNKKD